MGIFDDLASKAGGMLGGLGGKDSSLISAALELVQNKLGGLGGLLEMFKAKGLGDIVSSWIGKGDNKPISREDLEKGLGKENITEVARKAGTTEDEAANKLTGLLPKVIDMLTPDGKSDGNLMDKASGFLGKNLGFS